MAQDRDHERRARRPRRPRPRPRSAARAFAARTSACGPRGPAPKRTNSRDLPGRARVEGSGRAARRPPPGSPRRRSPGCAARAPGARAPRPPSSTRSTRPTCGRPSCAARSRAPRPRSGTRRGSRGGSDRAAPRAEGTSPPARWGFASRRPGRDPAATWVCRADGDPPLLHGLEERGLRLGRRAVDLVGEDQVVEDGAGQEAHGRPPRSRPLAGRRCR